MSRNRQNENAPMEVVSLPLVYAYLTSKQSEHYSTVLRAVVSAAETYGILNCQPRKIMSDFEKSITIAFQTTFPAVRLSDCFFHMSQSIYRHIQSTGLQEQYNTQDSLLKLYTHMLAALAFVPEDHVEELFDLLKTESPRDLTLVIDYFAEYYVIEKPATGRGRGRIRALPPRYSISFWNHYQATINGKHRTNNISEGWHNRFHILMGKIIQMCIQLYKKSRRNKETPK